MPKPPSRSFALALALAGALLAAPAGALADVPAPGALYETGPTGRFLMDAGWQFRIGNAAWTPVDVPYSWDVQDPSDASYLGTVATYRKTFTLPTSARAPHWVVRFESVNYRTKVSLNGRPIGSNVGAYLPFEFQLPDRLLRRRGPNTLTVTVDNRRTPADIPPGGRAARTNRPVGGWWNYGGILREVYLRRIDHVDISPVQVQPKLGCRTCPARVLVRATVTNYDKRTRPVRLAGTFGSQSIDLGSARIAPQGQAVFQRRITVAHPQLWEPGSPRLYKLTLDARVAGKVAQTWTTQTGIRSIVRRNGVLWLNGRRMNVRGFGLHEDSLDKGFAIDNAARAKIIAAVQETGATMIRSHYPLHPELLELADRKGILVWSEIPFYQLKQASLKLPAVQHRGEQMLTKNILVNGTHPSIVIWSIGNELNSNASRAQGQYIRDSVRIAHRLDPTRPVGLAYAGNPHVRCQVRYGPLDVLGLNEYFSWYAGPDGSSADRDLLSEYLDRQHDCYAGKAMFITETGAEANREGPAEERGTYAFQQDFIKWQFGVIDTKPWLSGALYWALQEFRVRPDWDGGDPRPNPPFHQKGIFTLTWEKKPAFLDIQRIFKATKQLG